MSKTKRVSTSEFYCTYCGKKGIPIARLSSQQREPGHLKKLFCLYCQKETNHVEIKAKGQRYTVDDFQKEFLMGRYVEGKKIPVSELFSCKEINCPYNDNGKCWNSNNSFKCEVRK